MYQGGEERAPARQNWSQKINFADVCAISAATTTSSSLSSRPALCNHGHDHHAHHTPFSLPFPPSPPPPSSTERQYRTGLPTTTAFSFPSSTVRKRQRASVSELRQRSSFSPCLPRLSESIVRELRPADTERTYFGWVRAHDPCAVVTRTLPVDQSTQ